MSTWRFSPFLSIFISRQFSTREIKSILKQDGRFEKSGSKGRSWARKPAFLTAEIRLWSRPNSRVFTGLCLGMHQLPCWIFKGISNKGVSQNGPIFVCDFVHDCPVPTRTCVKAHTPHKWVSSRSCFTPNHGHQSWKLGHWLSHNRNNINSYLLRVWHQNTLQYTISSTAFDVLRVKA